MRRLAALIGIVLGASACARCDEPRSRSSMTASDARPTAAENTDAEWPVLPTTPEAAKAIIEAKTTRPAGKPLAEIDASSPSSMAMLGRSIDAAIERGDLAVGLAAIDAVLRDRVRRAPMRRFYLLWGTHHDSAAQVDVFRRLTGMAAKTKWDRVALEQLRADGHWRLLTTAEAEAGVEASSSATAQRGESDDLRRWYATGSKDALDAIEQSQEHDDYAAWKFGYVSSIVDIVSDARVANHPVDGCDMPLELQLMLGDARLKYSNALRELHCALALDDAGHHHDVEPPARSFAVLWGAQHVGGDGFVRFLPADADVLAVRVLGGRPITANDEIARAIAARFDFVEPLFIPMSESDAIVVLPDPSSATHVEQKRVRDPSISGSQSSIANNVSITALADEIMIDGRHIRVPHDERIAPGPHVIAVAASPRKKIASFVVPNPGWIEIRVEQTAPELTLTTHVH